MDIQQSPVAGQACPESPGARPPAGAPIAVGSVEAAAMSQALQAARRGTRGANPLVGAVIVDPSGTTLGTGFHRGAGTEHAEIAALADASSRGLGTVAGSTMVVTLEPCNHRGRTGPCSVAVRAAGIRKVVYAAPDLTPSAAGGAHWLRSHGVECVGGFMAAQSQQLNERWLRAQAEERPFVTLKIAQSLDGRVAAADGSSQWITGSAARADGHRIRGLADAVLVGTGTALADDPRLTARLEHTGEAPGAVQPLRVVMGLRPVPATARVRGEGFLQLDTRDPGEALRTLAGRGVGHVLVEGGPGIAGAFLRAGLVDELLCYIAPLVLGSGQPGIPELGISSLASASRWAPDDVGGSALQQFGQDARFHLRPAPTATAAAPAATYEAAEE